MFLVMKVILSILTLFISLISISQEDDSWFKSTILRDSTWIKKTSVLIETIQILKANIEIQDVQIVSNPSEKKDTLVLYIGETRYHAKPHRHIRICYLSNPYQFYVAELGSPTDRSLYSIGKIDIIDGAIEILRKKMIHQVVREICYTIED